MGNQKYQTEISVAEVQKNIAGIIDHTLLRADATLRDLDQLCNEAIEYSFATVCVNPVHASYCIQRLKNGRIPVATVIGFPLGANLTQIKAIETETAFNEGATEFDMVINIGMLKSGDNDFVREDIEAVVKAARGCLVKVIIETALLMESEKVKACSLAKLAGAHFVKTSTGFSKAGATVQDVQLMRATVGSEMGVKAAGGVRTFAEAINMIEAGANRIGTSSGVQIVQQSKIL